MDAFLLLVEKHKLVAENSGILSLAALKKLNEENKKVVSLISGGNIDVLTILHPVCPFRGDRETLSTGHVVHDLALFAIRHFVIEYRPPHRDLSMPIIPVHLR